MYYAMASPAKDIGGIQMRSKPDIGFAILESSINSIPGGDAVLMLYATLITVTITNLDLGFLIILMGNSWDLYFIISPHHQVFHVLTSCYRLSFVLLIRVSHFSILWTLDLGKKRQIIS
jgi:hypothetical protein